MEKVICNSIRIFGYITFKTNNFFKETLTDQPLVWTKFYILTLLCNWVWHFCIKEGLHHQAIYAVLSKNQTLVNMKFEKHS